MPANTFPERPCYLCKSCQKPRKDSSRGRTDPQKDRCKQVEFSVIPSPRLQTVHGSHLGFTSQNARVLIWARAPTSCHCLRPTDVHRLGRRWASAQGGQPLQPAKVDSSGKWHLWLWVVSDEKRRNSLERGKESETEREREHRGCWEKIGAGSPFNLLINHANEILTGYSEAVLRGGREALVLDYTLSMWRGEKRSKICCRTKRWETCWPSAAENNHWRHERNQTSLWARKQKHSVLYTVINLDICTVPVATNHTLLSCIWCNQACDIVQFTIPTPYSDMSAPVKCDRQCYYI